MGRLSEVEKGIALVSFATLIFAMQDAATKYLGMRLPLLQFVGLRYLLFFFVALWYAHVHGGIRVGFKTQYPILQLARGLILAVELMIFAYAVQFIGIGYMHSVFITYPLMIIGLSPWLLDERVGWRRWLAVFIGFMGALVIIGPQSTDLAHHAIWPIVCAFLYTIYSVLTRKAALLGEKSTTSMIYTALVGCILFSPFVPFVWQPLHFDTSIALTLLLLFGSTGHLLVIIAYGFAPASILQPFNYLSLLWAIIIGYVLFAERLQWNAYLGAVMVVSSGVYVWLRERTRRSEHTENASRAS